MQFGLNLLEKLIEIIVETLATEESEPRLDLMARATAERQQLEEAINVIFESTSQTIGETFCQWVIRYLASVLNVRYLGISAASGSNYQRLRVIVLWNGEKFSENFEYDITGTPAEQVMAEGICFYPENVRAAFPEDEYLRKHNIESYWGLALLNCDRQPLGHLFVMDDKPILREDWDESLLKIIGARIRLELERIESEEATKATQAHLSRILDIAKDAIISVDPHYKIQIFNQGAEYIFGYKTEEILGQPLDLLLPEDLRAVHQQYIEQFSQSVEISRIMDKRPEVFGRRKDGTVFPAQASVSKLQLKEGTTYTVILRDITENKQTQERLKQYAFYDSLTKLPNRALFIDRLKQTINRALRQSNYLSTVLFLNLDEFRAIGNSLGRALGDQLLIGIARRLKTCLRPADTLARVGEDEFATILEEIKEVDDVIKVAKRIHQQLQSPFQLEGYEVFTTASIGIAINNNNEYQQPEELLRNADIAMHHAKKLGKGRYVIFDPQMHQIALARLRLETDLRRALVRSEFDLYYQPIVSLITGKLTGFEALIRWQHPQRGLVSPNQFIYIAEETGLIVPMGQWILSQACSQMQVWHQQFPQLKSLSVSVNLSGKQLRELNLVDKIDQILAQTDFDSRYLKLEITETILMENPEAARQILTLLKQRKINLSLDDFGTGYSSLNYLHRFPIDTLKIDRFFVSQVESNGDKLAIVRTIINLAHSLGIDAIAEGIETSGQLEQLQSLRCQQGQGYLFSKPLDCQEAEEFLRQQQ